MVAYPLQEPLESNICQTNRYHAEIIFFPSQENTQPQNQYFGVHKLQVLKEGKYIDITCPELVPDEVMKCLELKKEKKNKEKK